MHNLFRDKNPGASPVGKLAGLSRFDSVAITHMDSLYAYANWLTNNSQDSSEILREAYGEASRARDEGPDEQKILVRLFQILRRQLLRSRERISGGRPHFIGNTADAESDWYPDRSGGPADPIVEPVVSFLEGLVRRSIRSMPEEYGSAILLCEIENFSYFDIADIMECAVEEARRRVNEGQRWLRRELTRYSRVFVEEPTLRSSASLS